MKIKNLSGSSLFSYLCIPALLIASLSSSAGSLTATSSMQAIAIINQQTADSEPNDVKAEESKPTEVKDQAAEDEKRKKYCATARKNLELLRANTNDPTFTTEKGSIVRYTPDQLKKMIKESEAAEKANCD